MRIDQSAVLTMRTTGFSHESQRPEAGPRERDHRDLATAQRSAVQQPLMDERCAVGSDSRFFRSVPGPRFQPVRPVRIIDRQPGLRLNVPF